MKQYKINIKTNSDTLFASGQGSAAIDSATRSHKNGLPYIPAKTLKGLLKESAIEVQEILGKEWESVDEKDIINQVFGSEGVGNHGLITIENAEIVNKCKYIKDISNNNLLPEEVIQYFTRIRQQTAIDKDGIAKEGSLRSSLVLNEAVRFSALVSLNYESKEVIELLKKACFNLRRVGTNRNRGFGQVSVQLVDYVNKDKITNPLKGNTFMLTLKSPALLPTTQMDANTVSSEKIISGRKILGMLASSYIKLNNLNSDAHKNAEFQSLFLNGNITFSDAYPVNDNQIFFPIGSHWKTNKEKDATYNDYDKNEGKNLKAIGGLVNLNGSSKASVSTVLDFHNSRNKVNQKDIKGNHSRIAGSNKGAGIFYYEKLEEGQSFVFKVDGDETIMDIIRKLLTNDEDLLRIGKSTSTNLGQIEVKEWNSEWTSNANLQNEEVILTFISPVLLKNKFGDYEASVSCLENYLSIKTIEAKDTRLRTQMVQVFQGAIKMQFPEMVAIEAGSSIKLKRSLISDIILAKEALGEFTDEGYGRFVIEDQNNHLKIENLKNLIQVKDNGNSSNNAKLKDIIITDDSTKFLKFIDEQRKTLESKKLGDSDVKLGLHKGTTMQMIQLFKMVKQSYLNEISPFTECLRIGITKQLEKNVYSIKTLDNIEKIIGNLEDGTKRKRKESTDEFKIELTAWMIKGFDDKSNKVKLALSKIEYWIAYFNKTKIKNRDGK